VTRVERGGPALLPVRGSPPARSGGAACGAGLSRPRASTTTPVNIKARYRRSKLTKGCEAA